jgi:hypothetical protein
MAFTLYLSQSVLMVLLLPIWGIIPPLLLIQLFVAMLAWGLVLEQLAQLGPHYGAKLRVESERAGSGG